MKKKKIKTFCIEVYMENEPCGFIGVNDTATGDMDCIKFFDDLKTAREYAEIYTDVWKHSGFNFKIMEVRIEKSS